ncbi:aldehyde dehydrogenase family protein [Chelativorans sp. J32]|uniref:aldehyde dehydrogenase family protein n=1 Tax=Chelativorans sp. J32 TaxID=935840 RepID=UPI000483791C|nr:aldehyde dehydrogenase family protein [Chelativorans sp. J32]
MTCTIQVRNPRNGKLDYEIVTPSREEMEERCTALRAGQEKWLEIGLQGRIKAMLEFCDAVDRHREAIIAALTEDTGRYGMSVAELEGVIGITKMRCATAEAALAPAAGNSSDPSLRFQQQYVPHQLVGIISPWNYPLILSMIDAITALLAGCAVAVKPSEVTPRFIVPFEKAIREVEYLRDVLAYFAGDGETGGNIVDLTDTLVFTGSVPTGKLVQQRAAAQFKTAFLELGGNDPAVVLKSADADTAAEIIVRGSVENSGQLCCAIERVYVDRSKFEELRDRIAERTRALTLNDGDINGDIGPVIFEKQVRILREHLEDAVTKGAKIVVGGEVVERNGGYWCEPTVLVDVTHDMRIMKEETFGPIIPIMAFDTEEEAVKLANDTEFGLSAAVIGDEARAIEIGSRINAGGLWINDFDTMGGVGDRAEKTAFGVSGLGGTRYGPGGFMRFMRKKAIVVRKLPA